MSMGTVEPIGGVDSIAFIRGAVEKYQGAGVDDDLLNYIEQAVVRARQDKGSAEQHPTTGQGMPAGGANK